METSPWKLVEQRAYTQAVEAYTHAILQEPLRAPYYANRAYAYLGMEQYEAAAQDWAEVIRLSPQSAHGYSGLAVCQWCLTSTAAAIATWKRGLDATSTDAAGGVHIPSLLLYAALRLSDQPLQKETWQLLRRHARRKLTIWPGPSIPYLLGKLSEDTLQAALEQAGQRPVLRERFQCQAAFWRGVRTLKEGRLEGFRAHMRVCAGSSYGYLEDEYYLARWEVANQFPLIMRAAQQSERPDEQG